MTRLLRSAGLALALAPLGACFDFFNPEPADLAEGLWALETTGTHLFGDCGAMGSVATSPGTLEVFVAVDHDEVTLSFGPQDLEGTLVGTTLAAEDRQSFGNAVVVEAEDRGVEEGSAEVDCMEPEEAAIDCGMADDQDPGQGRAPDDEVVYSLSGEVASREAFSGTLRVDLDLGGSVCSLTSGFEAALVEEGLGEMEPEPMTGSAGAAPEPEEG